MITKTEAFELALFHSLSVGYPLKYIKDCIERHARMGWFECAIDINDKTAPYYLCYSIWEWSRAIEYYSNRGFEITFKDGIIKINFGL